MKKFILVNPPLTMEERYGKLAASGNRLSPLNLCHLAAVLKEEDLEVSIFDTALYNLSREEVARRILERKPDYLGLTATTLNIISAGLLASEIKKRAKDIRIIIGGPHLTFLPEETMSRFPAFDLGVIGEGEETLKELIGFLIQGRSLETVAGLIFRSNGGLKRTLPRPFIQDLDRLPLPAWELLPDLGKFYCSPPHSYIRIPSGAIVSSRGCPGKCIFCGAGIFSRHMRAYSADYLIRMMSILKKDYRIRDIYFIDDNFIAFRKRLLDFCEGLQKENLGQVWSCQGRVDMVSPGVLKEMKSAGCWQIAYGLESGVQEILNNLKKGITLKEIRRALLWTKAAGIRTRGFFMFGNPGETKATMQTTINFARALPLDDLHITLLTPFPGSELYTTAPRFGEFNNDWSRMNGWDPVFVPFGLREEDLLFYQRRAFARFYFRPKVILGYLPFLRFPSQWLRLWHGLRGLFSLIWK